jgi:hypothetical protein
MVVAAATHAVPAPPQGKGRPRRMPPERTAIAGAPCHRWRRRQSPTRIFNPGIRGRGRGRDERGDAAIVAVAAMVITLVVFMAAANLIADSYGNGVVRTAVDEAAGAGSLQGAPGGPVAACQSKAAQVMANLMPGPFGQHITITCGTQGDQIVAVGTGSLPAWLKVVPTDTIHVVGTANLEQNPTP